MKKGDWWINIKKNRRKIIYSLIFLLLSVAIYASAGDYITDHKGYVSSQDLILDNIGPYNLSYIFIYFFIFIMALYFLYPLIYKPDELAYVIAMFSLFVIIRSGFIIFTHLSVPVDAIHVKFPGYLQLLDFSNALFFSGHAGLPFLGFLIYKKHHKSLSYFMLVSSVILGITVLLMHVHYSIDVFSAYFITYGIYKIGNETFPTILKKIN